MFTRPGDVELREEPAPVAGPGEALIHVRSSGICGSDLHGFWHVGMRKPPLIMGHEFAGADADGSRVVINPLLTCGTCAACLRGHSSVCANRQLIGVNRAGGFAEQVAVPTSALHRLPDGLPWVSAALIEPLANSVHALDLLGDPQGSLGIVGAGSIGLLTFLVARSRGYDVVLAEPSDVRRDTAQRLGATVVPHLGSVDREFDVTIDAVGSTESRRSALERLSSRGTSVWIGLAEADSTIGANDIVRSEKRVVGSFAYTDDEFAHAVTLVSTLDLTWVTPIPMAESERTFLELARGRSDIIKAVLDLCEQGDR
ncbi:MAG TPA: alcohol dehydrogenase catalytic domain-containing protein [Actinomycetes bacterium]|nr:alcohol dehydrogenase catalytic domain-containing protein [Actinomycetes bacterium]